MGIIVFGIIIAVVVWLLSEQFYKYKLPLRAAAGAIVIFSGVAAGTVVVPAGNVGVKTLFGAVQKGSLSEGLHIINPLMDVKFFSIRTQESFENADVPSREGLSISLEISLLFRLDAAMAEQVYQTIGETYKDVVVATTFRSAIRGATVNYEAKDLYTSGRELIAGEIFKELEKALSTRGIIVENVLLRKITLPNQVEEAINNKLAAEQEAERMNFVLQREEREAERKEIEAKGVAAFQRIVAEGINSNYLKWKAIESVNKLAESSNSKFVILGDKNGLPIILNDK